MLLIRGWLWVGKCASVVGTSIAIDNAVVHVVVIADVASGVY